MSAIKYISFPLDDVEKFSSPLELGIFIDLYNRTSINEVVIVLVDEAKKSHVTIETYTDALYKVINETKYFKLEIEVDKLKVSSVTKRAQDAADKRNKAYNDELIDSMKPYVEKYGSDMMNEFYFYWSEPGKTGLPRYRYEKTWEISRRLDTWYRNKLKRY